MSIIYLFILICKCKQINDLNLFWQWHRRDWEGGDVEGYRREEGRIERNEEKKYDKKEVRQ